MGIPLKKPKRKCFPCKRTDETASKKHGPEVFDDANSTELNNNYFTILAREAVFLGVHILVFKGLFREGVPILFLMPF